MGFLYSLFGGAPTKYDAQKYFDYAEKQKAKGNIVEALNYYAKVINHGDLGVKPFVPYIELCMEHDEWKKLPDCIKVYRKRFPKENSGWIDKIEKETIEQLRRQGLLPIEVQRNSKIQKLQRFVHPTQKQQIRPKARKRNSKRNLSFSLFRRILNTRPSENAMMSIVPVSHHLTFMREITKTKFLLMRTWKSVTT